MSKTLNGIVPVVIIGLIALIGIPTQGEIQSVSALTTISCQTQETSLGDLVADAARNTSGAAIALVPAGSFREVTIPKGKLKIEDVLKCLQYPEDGLTVMEITGDQLIQALERSVRIYPQKNLGFLQVSGISFQFDSQSPRGSRISTVLIGKDIIKTDSKYKVVMTSPLAGGAYGYFSVWGKGEKKTLKNTTLESAVKDYLSSKNSIDYNKTERITLKPIPTPPTNSGPSDQP